jgi:hypothetical protein
VGDSADAKRRELTKEYESMHNDGKEQRKKLKEMKKRHGDSWRALLQDATKIHAYVRIRTQLLSPPQRPPPREALPPNTRFQVVTPNKLGVLSKPDDGAEVLCHLRPAEDFVASHTQVLNSTGRIYYQLSDGRGWVPRCSRKDPGRVVVVQIANALCDVATAAACGAPSKDTEKAIALCDKTGSDSSDNSSDEKGDEAASDENDEDSVLDEKGEDSPSDSDSESGPK